jgi:hypothetical protein
MNRILQLLLLPVLLLAGCASPPDYSAFRMKHPRSVLVIPPLNESMNLKATYSVLSTVSHPLAEMGYYVFPVAVIDQFMKENGMPTPGEMNQVSLAKVDEIVGADAVLYMLVKEYGTKYTVIDSSTVVHLTARLVDVESGELLWSSEIHLYDSSSSAAGGDLVAMLITATVDQVISHTMDESHAVAVSASQQLFRTRNKGLLYGPYHPGYGTD